MASGSQPRLCWWFSPAAGLAPAGSGPNDVWAVGWNNTILHWDGGTWTPVSTHLGADAGYEAVWGSGPNDVWAAGYTNGLVHWNGTAWTSVCIGTTNDLHAIWGSGPNDVWAVGEGGTILKRGP